MIRQAIAGAMPPPHRYSARAKPKLGAVASFIDAVLDEDRRAPRKQRHTARRIYRLIPTEFPDAAVAESTVRNHVQARKRAMGLILRETFVPQSYVLGQETLGNAMRPGFPSSPGSRALRRPTAAAADGCGAWSRWCGLADGAVRGLIDELYGHDLHAEGAEALAGATFGMVAGASLAVATIG